jgi:hypothetical protein
MIESTEFTREKLVNTTPKQYREILLILNDLTNLLTQKMSLHSSNNQFSNQVNFLDDFVSLDLNNMSSFGQANNQLTTNSNDELFSRKIQLLEDPNYFKEFRNAIDYSSSGNSVLIPSDLAKVFKSIIESSNSNSSDLNSQFRMLSNENLLNMLQENLKKCNEQLDNFKKESGEIKEGVLVNLIDDKDKINELNTKFLNSLNEIHQVLNRFNSSWVNSMNKVRQEPISEIGCNKYGDAADLGVESKLGQLFRNRNELYENVKQLKKIFCDWSSFLKQQKDRQIDYEKNCDLVQKNNVEKTLNEIEVFESRIKQCLTLIGHNSIFSNENKSIEKLLHI